MRVGREVKQQVTDAWLEGRKPAAASAMSDEERRTMADALMSLPKDRIVPAMRSAGLDREADETERRLAEEHLLELRREQLEGIMSLPVEERLPRLIAEGFTEEAKALSEELSAGSDESEKSEIPVQEAAPSKAKAQRKKCGRTKKSSR